MDMHKVDIFFDQTLKSSVSLYHTALPDNDLVQRFPIKRIPGAGHSMFVIAMSAYLVARGALALVIAPLYLVACIGRMGLRSIASIIGKNPNNVASGDNLSKMAKAFFAGPIAIIAAPLTILREAVTIVSGGRSFTNSAEVE
ncbi:MAG: hypothetical protein NT065_01090 [Chlamydiae bacterium]|nr:hypothetical protein [Chlamydiota bacterium]